MNWFKRLRADVRGRVVQGVVDILVGVIVIGSMGAAAFNFGAANFSAADASVRVMVGTVVPMLAGVGLLLVFISGRRQG